MDQLDWITVKGFKSIAEAEKLSLGPVTVLIGPNGSGKSNFIEVFSFLNAVGAGHLRDYVIRAGGADRILHFGSRVTKEMQIGVSFAKEVGRYDIDLVPNASDELIPHTESLSFWHEMGAAPSYDEIVRGDGTEAGISKDAPSRGISFIRRHLDSWRLYHFQDTGVDSPMKKMAHVNDNRYLRSNGSNLASFLYLIRSRHEDAYDAITAAVRQVAPFFEDFILEPLRQDPSKIFLEWEHKGTDAYFDASSLSDGTLRFMALATLFLQPRKYRPSIILVDEPELGMHPFAITLLASLMKHASAESQVIVSTQSSLLLDHFEPEQVLVAEREDGSTRFNRLEASELAPWLDDYSLGQLWEKNELGGRPRPE